jgi:hypothetical protein
MPIDGDAEVGDERADGVTAIAMQRMTVLPGVCGVHVRTPKRR